MRLPRVLYIIAGAALCLPLNAQIVTAYNYPGKLIRKPDGSWVADFGKAAFGTLVLDLRVTSYDTLIIHLGEKLSEPFTIDRKPGGTIRYNRVKLAVNPRQEHYILNLPPDKRNTSPPAIILPDSMGVVMPFRYCEIENFKGNLVPGSLLQMAYHWKFNPVAGGFSSSDSLLNQIWELCKYTIKATSFAGYYIDGDRERIPYEADAYINQLSHYAVDNEYEIARRTCEYFIDHPTWPTEWILHTVMLFYQDYMYTGDTGLISKYYDKLKVKTLTALSREDGLISSYSRHLTGVLMSELGFRDTTQRIRDIVDWPPAQKDTGWKLATEEGERDGYEMKEINTVVNSFHYHNLVLMADIAKRTGKAEDSNWFYERALKVREAINTKLFDTSRGVYIDGEGSDHASLHANMFPLAFGLVPEENIPGVVKFIKSRGMACSVYGAQFLLDGLYEAGEAEYAFSLLTATHDRSWYNMIKAGSTMTLEAWDIKYKPNLDWNHAWGATPANIIARNLWGIKPVAPGFEKALIRPQMSGLAHSEITLPTIKGPVHGRYVLNKNGSEIYFLSIPDSIAETEFVLPHGFSKVLINSHRHLIKKPVINLQPGDYKIELLKSKRFEDK